MQQTSDLVAVALDNGISRQLLRRRLELGWSEERAATEPARQRTKIPAAVVAEIRERRRRREPCRAIARALGVSYGHAAAIARGTERKQCAASNA
jgi:transposase-like protein